MGTARVSNEPLRIQMPNPVRCWHCTKCLFRSMLAKLTSSARTTRAEDEYRCPRCGKMNYVIGRP